MEENNKKHKIEHYMTKGLFFDRKLPKEFFENVFIKVNSDNSLVFQQSLRGGMPVFLVIIAEKILEHMIAENFIHLIPVLATQPFSSLDFQKNNSKTYKRRSGK